MEETLDCGKDYGTLILDLDELNTKNASFKSIIQDLKDLFKEYAALSPDTEPEKENNAFNKLARLARAAINNPDKYFSKDSKSYGSIKEVFSKIEEAHEKKGAERTSGDKPDEHETPSEHEAPKTDVVKLDLSGFGLGSFEFNKEDFKATGATSRDRVTMEPSKDVTVQRLFNNLTVLANNFAGASDTTAKHKTITQALNFIRRYKPSSFESQTNESAQTLDRLYTELETKSKELGVGTKKPAGERAGKGPKKGKEVKKEETSEVFAYKYPTIDADYSAQVQTGTNRTFAENKLTIPQLNRAIEKCNELISKYEKMGDNRSVARFITMKKRYINARGKILSYYNKMIIKNPALATRKNYLTVAMIKGGSSGNGWSSMFQRMGRGIGKTMDTLSDHRGLVLATGITATSALVLSSVLNITKDFGGEIGKETIGKYVFDAIKKFLGENPLVSAAISTALVTTFLTAVPAIKDRLTRSSNHKLERKVDRTKINDELASMDTQQNQLVNKVEKSAAASLNDPAFIEEISQSPTAMAWLKNAIEKGNASNSLTNLTDRQKSFCSALLAKAEQRRLKDINRFQSQEKTARRSLVKLGEKDKNNRELLEGRSRDLS